MNTELLSLAERVQLLRSPSALSSYQRLMSLSDQLRKLSRVALTPQNAEAVVESFNAFALACDGTIGFTGKLLFLGLFVVILSTARLYALGLTLILSWLV